jgi:hypothetical protein
MRLSTCTCCLRILFSSTPVPQALHRHRFLLEDAKVPHSRRLKLNIARRVSPTSSFDRRPLRPPPSLPTHTHARTRRRASASPSPMCSGAPSPPLLPPRSSRLTSEFLLTGTIVLQATSITSLLRLPRIRPATMAHWSRKLFFPSFFRYYSLTPSA